jgi:phage shock protein A
MDLTLDQQIDKAHAEAEKVEDNARQLEARIVKAGGVPPTRRYGKPVNAAAIAENLTLRSILQRRDPALANYLGCGSDYQRQQAEAEALKAEIKTRLEAKTAELRQQNQQAQQHRERYANAGINAVTGRRLGL